MKLKTIYILIIFAVIANAYGAYNVIDFTISCKSDETRIKVNTSDMPNVQDTILQSPDRLVLDFEGGIHQFKSKEFSNLPAGLVMRVRTSQFKPEPNRVTRVVFDLAETPKNYRVESLDDGISITMPTKDYPEIDSYKSGRKANIPPAPQEEKPEPEPEPEKPEDKLKTEKEDASTKVEEPKPEKTDTVKEEKSLKEQPKQEPQRPETPEEIEKKAEEKKTQDELDEFIVLDAEQGDIVVDTTEKAYYLRNRIEYDKTTERDPFEMVQNEISAEIGAEINPSIESLKLVGIVGSENNFNALMQDGKGFGYMLSPGDSVLNGIVVEVSDSSITFTINEYGYIRNVTMPMEKRKK